MITLSNLSKNYGSKVLFENINQSIYHGEKIGLIGPNGAGKTTLFSLIRQEIEPSAGEVQVNKNIHIGYLPQESKFESEQTVLAELTEAMSGSFALKKKNPNWKRRIRQILIVTAMCCMSWNL